MKDIMKITTFLLILFATFFSIQAQAACANPAGTAGDMVFNSDYAVLQWCDGTDWNGFPKTGPLTGPGVEGAGCAAPVGKAGDLIYNDDYKVLQWCDGQNWIGLPSTGGGNAPCTNPAGDPGDIIFNSDNKILQWCNGQNWWGVPLPKVPLGFFVMTNNTYTGNLGGLAGANATCLNELTNNDWKGKSAGVTLTSGTVRAWLCSSVGCQNLASGVLYKFALAGDTTKGGNYLYSDYVGRGPFEDGYVNAWRTNGYFGVTTNFWSGRNSFSQTTDGLAWEDEVFPLAKDTNTCSDWTSTATNGQYGQTDPASCCHERAWSSYFTACSTTFQRLICIVDPLDTKDRTPVNPGFTNINNASAGVSYTTTGIVSGVTTEVTAIINSIDTMNTANWRAYIRNVTSGTAWSNRVVVKNGDTIELQMASDFALGSAKSVAVSIGTQQFTWTITNRLPNPQGKVGYFAMTKTTYTGDLGGLAGANAACLEEFQSQSWFQKGRIAVSATNTRAFLCDGTSCNNFQPNTKYEFSGVGSSSNGAGGAIFYTDASGNAPNSSGVWGNGNSVAAYIYGGVSSWWTGRGVGTAVSMPTTTSGQHCTNWTVTTGNGTQGALNTTATGRWSSTTAACTTAKALACIINPPSTGFGFDDVNDATANTVVTKSFAFTALTAAVSAQVVSGLAEIRKNAGAWGKSIASLNNGDTIDVRVTSSVIGNAAHISNITVGDADVEWIVRTKDTPAVIEQKIQPGSGSQFGSKIARYKNTMAVANGNSVLIYNYSAPTWSLVSTKTSSFAAITSLAIDDDTLVLGYNNYNAVAPPPYYPGGISIWQKGASWTTATELVIPEPTNTAYTYYGSAVATYGNFVAAAGQTGKIYIYENTGSGWASATVTTRTTSKNIYYFRYQTMVMKGNTIAIGTHPVNNTGQIEVITNTGSGWGMGAATVNIISTTDSTQNDQFGSILDLSDDESTIVTAAPAKRKVMANGQSSWEHGTAYIFEKIGDWSLKTETVVLPSQIKPSVQFGSSVAVYGNTVAIGSAQAMGDGAVYLYKKTSTWSAAVASAPVVLMQHLTSTNQGYVFDSFGLSLSLCGSVIVTGAPYSSEVTSNRGYLYSHDISSLTGGQSCL